MCLCVSDCIFLCIRVFAMIEENVYAAAVNVQILVSRWVQPVSQISRCVTVCLFMPQFISLRVCTDISYFFNMYKCLRKCLGMEKINNFKKPENSSPEYEYFFVLSRLSWVCVKLQEVVSSVRLGRQERIKRKRSVISVLSKLPW